MYFLNQWQEEESGGNEQRLSVMGREWPHGCPKMISSQLFFIHSFDFIKLDWDRGQREDTGSEEQSGLGRGCHIFMI